MDKTSFRIFILGVIVSLLIFGGILFLTLKLDSKEEIKVKYVDNPTMFFTVENCVNKYVGLISAKDSEALYNVIDEKYKEENGITVYNVLANNKSLDGNYSFVSSYILEDKNEKYKYYVKGYLIEETMDDDNFVNEKMEYSIIVKLDTSNKTYSVILSEVGEYFDAV